MKNLQQCTHCLMVVSKDDTTCPSCGESIDLDFPEAASGCYEPEPSDKKSDDVGLEIVLSLAIWFAVGFLVGFIL